MEDNLTFVGKWKMASIFLKMEDDLIFLKMEDDLNFFENGRQPVFWSTKYSKKQNITNWNNGCGTAPGNLVVQKYHSRRGTFLHLSEIKFMFLESVDYRE